MNDIDPSEGMNDYMPEHLTMWGTHIGAQMREHPTLHFPPGDLPPRVTSTQSVMVLHHVEGAPRSPEHGEPWIIGSDDLERLRDLLHFAEMRGMIPPLRSGGDVRG
ncbi:hypothetical protein NIIDNTM18_42620 [Mycolicibacterium litorale]|uniref:Uncharacterized protein n=1 Tax=Mycolicibacterium litorale TaxID=758802 RepID=A0A6S6P8J3_9MYCO|nr:hypothetical protein [Mycolicibacterium litorale]BCI54984.1 hypothetical protein NIIDNTM18_42620 [Mycolicibacterium litorale]